MNGQIREVYIVSAKRTAVAKKGGAMRFVRPKAGSAMSSSVARCRKANRA